MIWRANGTSSRRNVLSALEIIITRSPINTIMLLASHHPLQTCHCRNQLQTCHCSNQLQNCHCNNVQSPSCHCNSHSQMCPCYSQLQACLCNSHCPCSPQYCQLHYQRVPSFHPHSLLLLHRCRNAHQRAASASSRPFQKRMSQLSQEGRELGHSTSSTFGFTTSKTTAVGNKSGKTNRRTPSTRSGQGALGRS